MSSKQKKDFNWSDWSKKFLPSAAIFFLIAILFAVCFNFFRINCSWTNCLERGVFDKNVLTFMTSFLLVFLGGILISIENRADKRIKEGERRIKKIRKKANEQLTKVIKRVTKAERQVAEAEKQVTEAERQVTEAEKQVTEAERQVTEVEKQVKQTETTLKKLESGIAQLEADRNTMTLFAQLNLLLATYYMGEYFRLSQDTESLFNEVRDGKYKCITKEWKELFDGIIKYKMLRELKRDQDNALPNKNHERDDCITVLEKLQKEILGLREVQ